MENIIHSSGKNTARQSYPYKAQESKKNDIISVLDKIVFMNDFWNLLFKKEIRKTRKDFKLNVTKVIKSMVILANLDSYEIATIDPYRSLHYYSHGIIRKRSNLPKWTYYNVIDFLKENGIVHITKKNLSEVSHKEISSKFIKKLEIMGELFDPYIY